MKKILTLILFATSFLLTRAESYQIKIIDGDSELTFICDDDQTIYESAKLSGYDLGYDYDSGATSVSIARLESGTVNLSKQSYLDQVQIDKNLVLLTVAYPEDDCVFNLDAIINSKETKSNIVLPPYAVVNLCQTENYGDGKMHTSCLNMGETYNPIAIYLRQPTTGSPLYVSAILEPYEYRVDHFLAGLAHKKTTWRVDISNHGMWDVGVSMHLL